MCRATDCSVDSNYDLGTELGLASCDYLGCDDTDRIRPGKNDLSIMQLNIRGLLNKQGHLIETIRSCQPDIILLCETWLNTHTETLVDIPGYKLITKNRLDRIGGGVGILVNQNLKSRKREDLCMETHFLEHQIVELKTDSKNILVMSGYRPPNTSLRSLLTEYKSLVSSLKKCKSHELVIGIDHNLDFIKAHMHIQTSDFIELNLTNDLLPCITKPTRITHKTATLIDNIFVSLNLQQQLIPFILTDDISDHLPIVAILGNQRKCLKESKTIRSRNLCDENIDKIKTDLININWDEALDNKICNDSFNIFHQTLTNCINMHAPEEIRKISYKMQVRDPWMTKGLLTSLKKQKRLYREQLHSSSTVSTANYKKYRNTLKSLIRKSKITYLHEKCTEFKRDSRKLWQLVNRIIGKSNNKIDSIDSLKIDSILKYDPSSITNGLCEFFANIGEEYANKIDSSGLDINNHINNIETNPTSLYLAPTTMFEVKELIKTLPQKTSSGMTTSLIHFSRS